MIANKPLNYQAITLEEAETEIRLTVRDEFIKRTPKPRINKIVAEIIGRALRQIKIPSLRQAAKLSLVSFYTRQYRIIGQISPTDLEIITVLGLLASRKITSQNSRVIGLKAKGIFVENYAVSIPKANLYGVPMRKFMQDYTEDNVRPVIDRLCKEQARDPNDLTGRNTLRNLAEMEVRYNDHLQQIEDLKTNGERLVIASTHADCSDRCRNWQGKVYSLDGSYGTTDDGRQYQPLENATDVFYTTKAGITYKNGLLGFNCRHYLVPYKNGFKFPKPDVKEERKQYAITLKQRELERNVRAWRTKAVESKGLDEKAYETAKQKAYEWNKLYIKFSQENQRAYYPSRTKVI